MKKLLITLSLIITAMLTATAQINVQLLHQLVSHSKDEHSMQQTARERQAVASANEEVNRNEMGKLKTRYRELQRRFHTLGLVLQGLSMGLEATPIVNETIAQQKRIIAIAGQHPEFSVLAFDAERDMADKAVQLGRYLTALLVSIGDLNQMKSSDRRILFSHVIGELRALAGASRGLANTMYYATRKKLLESAGPFSDFINQDKQIVDNILRRLEDLGS